MNIQAQHEIVKNLKRAGLVNVQLSAIAALNERFIESNGRLVLVMSHTCCEDFLLGLIMFHSCEVPVYMFTNFRNPVWKHFAKKMGMITHQKGTSNTESIIRHLSTRPKFGLLIGLGRTELNETVHSGYFYVARKLQARIAVVGFDYYLKTGYTSQQSWMPHMDETYENFSETTEPEILKCIQEICPRKPHLQVGFKSILYPYADVRGLGKDFPVFRPNLAALFAQLGELKAGAAWQQVSPQTAFLFGALVLSLFFFFCLLIARFVAKKAK
jgi:hypothetical protein